MKDKEILCSNVENTDMFGMFHAANFEEELNTEGFPVLRKIADDLDELTHDFSSRQIIPYVSIISKAHSGYYVLAYERLSGGNESRLHNLISLGFGGHVGWTEGVKPFEMLQAAIVRELDEELGVDVDIYNLQLRGNILADLTSVDRYHLGVFYVYDIGPLNKEWLSIKSPEKSKIRPFWTHTDYLHLLEPRMETWSKIILNHLK